MPKSSTEPVTPDQRSYAGVFSDRDGGPSGEQRRATSVWRRVRPRLKVDNVILRNIRQPKLAMTRIRVGASYTSLDLWYVDLDVGADARSYFTHWLSHDELAKAKRFRSDLHRARYIVGRAALQRVLADRLGCSPAAHPSSSARNAQPPPCSARVPLA